MADPDPFEALTLAEAARAAAVSEAVIRRRVERGELLHEVGRRRGKEVKLVRRMDLALLWPEVLPEQAVPRTGTEPASEPGAVAEPEPSASATEAASSTPLEEERDFLARQGHAFEVRLASLQSANEGLTGQVRDLQLQRSDLKDMCADLRGRMVLIEKERQASTAGLLLAQRRLLELEAAGSRTVDVPWSMRPGVWGAACLAIVLGYGWFWQRGEAQAARRTATEQAGALQEALEDGAEERAVFQAELESWRSSSAALGRELLELTRRGEQHSAEAAALRAALERGQARESQLLTELGERETSAAAEREAFVQRLDTTLEEAALARQLWIEERAALDARLAEERQAAALERARFQDALDERARSQASAEQALQQELVAARAATAALQEQVANQVKQDSDRQARLEESLDRLATLEEELRRAEAARVLGGLFQTLKAGWRR